MVQLHCKQHWVSTSAKGEISVPMIDHRLRSVASRERSVIGKLAPKKQAVP
jgi:hypothetical protein